MAETRSIDGKKIVIYRWGEISQDYVLLIHGWSGRASQLGAFINPFINQGVAVISFDAPGHGESEGDETNIYEIANVVNAVVRMFGIPKSVIAHSFGCMVAAMAIRKYQLPIKKFVAISCPTDSRYLVAGFVFHFKLSNKVLQKFNNRLTQQFGNDFYEKTSADVNLAGLAIELLVVHDKDDQIVQWQQSEKLARAVTGSETYFTNNLEHQRLLRDEELIKKVVSFVLK